MCRCAALLYFNTDRLKTGLGCNDLVWQQDLREVTSSVEEFYLKILIEIRLKINFYNPYTI